MTRRELEEEIRETEGPWLVRWWRDRRLGVTPVWVDVCPTSEEPILIAHPGYVTATVKPGALRGEFVEVRLEPDQRTAHDARERTGAGGGSVLRSRTFLKSSLLLLGAGSAALGLHFKERADDAYDEYLHTGHDQKMREAFNRAEKYDAYALGCWVAAELSLIGLVYLLVKTPAAQGWNVAAGACEDTGGSTLMLRCEF